MSQEAPETDDSKVSWWNLVVGPLLIASGIRRIFFRDQQGWWPWLCQEVTVPVSAIADWMCAGPDRQPVGGWTQMVLSKRTR